MSREDIADGAARDIAFGVEQYGVRAAVCQRLPPGKD
jgi:hypothetical protein